MGEIVKLEDYAEILTGYPFKSAGYVDNAAGVRLLRGDNIGQGRVRWDGAKSWPCGEASSYNQYQLDAGDVVVAMDRPWIEAGLKYAQIRPNDLPCLLVQRVARMRARRGLDQRFLSYLIAGLQFANHILSVQTGTAVPHISSRQIGAFEFALPPLPTQAAVAALLGALDDKTAANRQISESALNLAQARYAYMRLGKATWKERHLGDVATLIMGQSPPGKSCNNVGEGYPLLNGPTEFRSHFPNPEQWTVASTRMSKSGDLLLCVRGSTTGRLNWADQVYAIGRGIAAIRADKLPQSTVLIDFALRLEMGELLARANGSVFPNLSRSAIESFPIPWPDEDSLQLIVGLLTSCEDLISSKEKENLALAQLRDTLLPKLMSGELRVRDAEKVVEEAT